MSPRSPLGAQQQKLFADLAKLGLCNDESLAAHLRALGISCDRSTLWRYRSGERTAPLALLALLLSHCDEQQRIAVLEIWARPLGLVVLPQELSVGERWAVRMKAAELRRLGDELENLSADRRAA